MRSSKRSVGLRTGCDRTGDLRGSFTFCGGCDGWVSYDTAFLRRESATCYLLYIGMNYDDSITQVLLETPDSNAKKSVSQSFNVSR